MALTSKDKEWLLDLAQLIVKAIEDDDAADYIVLHRDEFLEEAGS